MVAGRLLQCSLVASLRVWESSPKGELVGEIAEREVEGEEF